MSILARCNQRTAPLLVDNDSWSKRMIDDSFGDYSTGNKILKGWERYKYRITSPKTRTESSYKLIHNSIPPKKRRQSFVCGYPILLTLTYATGGMSALRPVNMVTNVNMHVTSRVTRPGMASRSSQKLNQDSITTRDEGAKVWIRWCPIWRSNLK